MRIRRTHLLAAALAGVLVACASEEYASDVMGVADAPAERCHVPGEAARVRGPGTGIPTGLVSARRLANDPGLCDRVA